MVALAVTSIVTGLGQQVAQAAPPSFEKEFVPDAIGSGTTSTLTFTIVNVEDSDATNLAFTDPLPAGVTVAAPSNATNSCGGTLTAIVGSSSIDLTGGTVLEGEQCSITVDVTSSTPGFVVNTTGDLTSDLGNSGSASDTLYVSTTIPTFSKAFSPSTIGPGSGSILTLTITNLDATSPVGGLAFTDPLPAGLTLGSPANASNTCDGTLTAPDGGTSITLADGEVGASSSCQISVVVTSTTPGTVTNTSGDLTSNFGNSGGAEADLTVDADVPGFSKAFAPAAVDLGERSRLTFTIDNSAGAFQANALSFIDNLPPGMTVADPADISTDCNLGAVTAVPGSSVISYGFNGIIAAGDTCTIGVDVVAGAGGTLVNVSGELTLQVGFGPLVSSGVAVASIDVNVDDLHIVKEFTSDPASAGSTTTLEFTITNFDRRNSASSIGFSDDLDAALTGLVASSLPTDPCGTGSALTGTDTITLTGGTLAPQASCTFTVDVDVPVGATPGTYTNTTGDVTGTVSGSPVTGNQASDDLFVSQAPLLTKTFTDDPVATGGTVNLEFTITDTTLADGTEDIAFLDELTDILPFPLSVTLPANGFCGGSSTIALVSLGIEQQGIQVSGASLASGASCTFDLDIDIPAGFAASIYENVTGPITATLISDGSTVTGAPATDFLTVVGAPQFNKEFLTSPISPGDTVDLQFTLTNGNPQGEGDQDGSVPVSDIAFTDSLLFAGGVTALGLPLVDPCGTGSSLSLVGTDLVLADGFLDASSECQFTVTLQTDGALTIQGTYTNTTSNLTGTAEGVAVTGDPAEADLTVVDLVVTKEFTDDPVLPGAQVTLQFVIDNADGSADATSIVFLDDLGETLVGLLPATGELPLTDPCGAGSSATLVGGPGIWFTGGSVDAGSSCSFSIVLDVPANAVPTTYPNQTSAVSADIGGDTVTLPGAADILVVTEELEVGLAKQFSPPSAQPGGTSSIVFELSNPSATLPITGISFTDDLAAVGAGLSATNLPLAACGGAMTGSAGDTLLTFTGGSLAGGEVCSFSVDVVVAAGTEAGSYENVTSEVTADDISGPAATAPFVVDPIPEREADLSISKADDVDPATAGENVTYTITVDNAGPDPAVAVVTDILPAGLTLVSTSGCAEDPNGVPTCTLAEIAPGGSGSFTVTALVDAGLVGTVTNSVSVSSPNAIDDNPANDTADEDTTVVASADLSIDKVDDIEAAVAGQDSITYTVDVTNDGPSNATNVVVVDTLPAGVTYVSDTGGCVEAPAGTLTCSLGLIAAGGSASFDITVDVDSSTVGTITNEATVSSDADDPDPENNVASEDTEVVAEADLSISKSDSPDPATAGENLTYTITVDNEGPSDAVNVSVADALPAGVTFVSTSGCAEDPNGVPSCDLGDIAAGGSAQFTVTVSVDTDTVGTITNTATVSSDTDDPNEENDVATEDTTVVAEADLSIAKSDSPDPVVAGENLTYTITVDNAGPSDATNVVVSDTLPAGVSNASTLGCAEDPNGVPTCSLGDIAAGGSAQFTVTVSVDADTLGVITNTASVSSDAADPNSANDSASEDTTVVAEADLSITKVDSVDPVDVGDNTVYTIDVANAGPSDATNVVVTDNLPAGLSLVATSGCAEDPNGVPTCSLGTIPVGGSASYTIEVTADPGPSQTVTNTATVASDASDPDTGNNSASEDTSIIGDADLSIAKDDQFDPVVAGTAQSYSITVSNAGPAVAENVVVTDTLPAGVTFVSTVGCAEDPNGVPTCSLGSINPGDSASFTVNVTVDPDTTGTITNTASVASTTADPDSSNNSTSEDTEVVAEADLSIIKVDQADPSLSGKKLFYTITVANAGPSTAVDVDVLDTLPSGVKFKWTSGCDNDPDGVPTCELGTLEPGESAEIVVKIKVKKNTVGTITNTAEVTSPTPDPDPSNNIDTEDTLICEEFDDGEFEDCGEGGGDDDDDGGGSDDDDDGGGSDDDDDGGSDDDDDRVAAGLQVVEAFPSGFVPATADAATSDVADTGSDTAVSGDQVAGPDGQTGPVGTLPVTGSDGFATMPILALTLLVFGVALFGIGRNRRRHTT